MNYTELSIEEATNRLREHNEADWSDDRLWDEVIEPADVLYYLDAFGDQSLAINCQGLPKDLPDRVVEAVDEYDVFNDWSGTITETTCPLCDRTLYDFNFNSIEVIIDEWGGHHDFFEFLDDHSGYYWNAAGDEPFMCQSCKESPEFHGYEPETSSNSVRVFCGEADKFSRFSHSNGVIRWDFQWDIDYDKSTDLYNFTTRNEDGLVAGYQVAASFAKGTTERNAQMNQLGFKRIHVKEIEKSVSGTRKFWRYAKEILEEWAKLDSKTMANEPTHPDLDFTYIIEGQYQAWVPEEHYEKFKAELVWQALRNASKHEEAKQYRNEHDDLLSVDYGAA